MRHNLNDKKMFVTVLIKEIQGLGKTRNDNVLCDRDHPNGK